MPMVRPSNRAIRNALDRKKAQKPTARIEARFIDLADRIERLEAYVESVSAKAEKDKTESEE